MSIVQHYLDVVSTVRQLFVISIADTWESEEIIFKHMYNYLNSLNLINNNQSGFQPEDSTTNQLIDLVNDIHKSFDNNKSLEVRAILLDISRRLTKRDKRINI